MRTPAPNYNAISLPRLLLTLPLSFTRLTRRLSFSRADYAYTCMMQSSRVLWLRPAFERRSSVTNDYPKDHHVVVFMPSTFQTRFDGYKHNHDNNHIQRFWKQPSVVCGSRLLLR